LSKCLKIKFDVSFYEATKSGGWGFVIRNNSGEVVAAGGHIVAVADAIVCQKALLYVSDQGLSFFELETDCSTLKLALTSSCKKRLGLKIGLHAP
jgi:ribonuclease HI